MAIAFDIATVDSTGASSPSSSSTASTVSGATLGLVWIDFSNNASTVSSVTWGGVSMTKLSEQIVGSQTFSLWAILNPASGVQTVVTTYTGSVPTCIFMMSYTGSSNTLPTNVFTPVTGSAASISSPVTTLKDNSWVVNMMYEQSSNSAFYSAGATRRIGNNGAGGSSRLAGDSNAPISPAGSYTDTAAWTGSASSGIMQVEIEVPPLPLTLSVSNTVTITESVTISILTIRSFSVFDSVSHTENFSSVTNTLTPAFSDLLGNIVVSGYKWLTSTLLSVQQSFVVRPYIQCKILDDTVQPNQKFAGVVFPSAQGTMVQAPDGSILAAGFGVGGILFTKSANFHTGSWDSSVLLVNSSTDPTVLSNGNNNRVVIACSDYINGSYHIDVFFYNNFTNTSANLNVLWYYSDDGGTTWNFRTISLSDMPGNVYNVSNPTKNLSLAAFKPRLLNGVVISGFLYLHPNGTTYDSGYLGYEIVYQRWNGTSFTGATPWSQKNVDSKDWTLHSIDSYYFNSIDYVLFSGFRNVLDNPNTTVLNYGIYLTSLLEMTDSKVTDLWSNAIPVFISLSVTNANKNSFTYPRANVVGNTINLTFASVTVDSVAQSAQGSSSTVVQTLSSVMGCQSQDGFNYTYPSPFVFNDGTIFTNSGRQDVSFVPNGIYYYLGGQGTVWEYIRNNILADITEDVIDYKISDSAGQPSSINLRLANQNNQWVGTSPTKPGASAISGNRRLQLFQGYYNSSGVGETVPQSTYYIDDITQHTDVSTNEVLITGRDLYKKLKITITKFAYSWMGPFLYTGVFDGTTLSNWQQQSGNWAEVSNVMSPSTLPTADAVLTLTAVPNIPYGSVMYVNLQRNAAGTAYVYAYFIDVSNWLRWSYTDGSSAWKVQRSINGIVTDLDSGVFGLGAFYYPIMVRQYDYYKFNFILGKGTGSIHGNDIQAFTEVVLFKNSTNGEFDCTNTLALSPATRWSVGIGCLNAIYNFQFFKYMQYNNPNSIAELVKALATKATVFSYDFQNIIADYFFATSQYTGTFTAANRVLKIAAGNLAMNNVVGNKISNGEVTFNASIAQTTGGTSYGFKFVFRSSQTSGIQAAYKWHVRVDGATGYVASRFEIVTGGVTYFVPAQSIDDNVTSVSTLGSLNFNLKRVNNFRVVMIDGWMYAFINNVMVNAWNDNNTTFAYYTTGFWGWETDANTTLSVRNVISPAFYKQIPSFSLNPGDDIEHAVEAVFNSVRGWYFTNLFSFFKAIFLLSTDPSTYTYQTQLFSQETDSSDKEYISQVTVYGSGVSATARDATLLAKDVVRDEVFVDYQITTLQDAQARANNELNYANQYRSQYTPKQVINVGAELFDAITVINTGNNTSGVSSTTRTYAQGFQRGSNTDYYMEIQSGNI